MGKSYGIYILIITMHLCYLGLILMNHKAIEKMHECRYKFGIICYADTSIPRLYLQYLFLTGIRVDLVLGDFDFWKPIRYIQVETDIFDQGVILLVFNISISRSFVL